MPEHAEAPSRPARRRVCIEKNNLAIRYPNGEPIETSNEWRDLPAEIADQWDLELWGPL